MRILMIFHILLLVSACSTMSPTSMPTSSELVLMAASHKNNFKTIATDKKCSQVDIPTINPRELSTKIKSEAVKQKIGLTAEETQQAESMLESRQFRSDLKGIVLLAISSIPNLAKTLPHSGASFMDKLNTIRAKIKQENVLTCLQSLSEYQSCLDLDARDHLFQQLYADSTAQLERDTLVALLNNKSFRIALIVYAHTNGIDIDDADLTFVQMQLAKPEFKVDALVDAGTNRLKEKYQVDEVKERLEALTCHH